jgi:hypothetical protein
MSACDRLGGSFYAVRTAQRGKAMTVREMGPTDESALPLPIRTAGRERVISALVALRAAVPT